MKIAVCCKITPDVESVQVDGQGNVDFGRAQWEMSQYDLQAIQAAMDIAQEGDEVVCVTVGNDQAVKSASVKALLSRGPHRLVGVSDEGCYEGDSAQTAQVLAAVAKREQFDIMVFGEGSADQYAQLTGPYTAALLGWPSVNYVCGIQVDGGQVTVERDLEQGIQTCSVATPCAVGVTSTINWLIGSSLSALGVESVDAIYVQSEAPVGTVVAVAPEPGRQAKDTPVMFTVSGRRILMPSLTGFTLENARALIEAEGMVLGTVTEGYAADALPNTVIAQSVAAGTELLTGATVEITVNQPQETLYYPASKLSVVVPLNGSNVQLTMVAPSGDAQEVYHGVLNTGTYRIALSSAEPGEHTVNIYMDGVLMESQTVRFE